jgi:hypothetical protein
METENKDWKPTVGQTAWHFDFQGAACLREVTISKRAPIGSIKALWTECGKLIYLTHLFPTPEAALSSIKVYDLDGHEVEMVGTDMEDFEGFMAKNPSVENAATELWEKLKAKGLVGHLPAAGAIPVHFTGVCSECRENIDLDPEQDAAFQKVVRMAYSLPTSPPKPDGEPRLIAAQEKFAKLCEDTDNLAPLEWSAMENQQQKATDGEFVYKIQQSGSWVVLKGQEVIYFRPSYNQEYSAYPKQEETQGEVHKWRVIHGRTDGSL